ncbi:hypothetical protein MAPG_11481 [Magnaporthiopsis poae ATCC 64411]|uniref:Uncharacterized protein n=1 Tax=Magnaporthiopsis poae (strain ATCC 64411 / 73-15) TaxID=644358 RepID=A0A0C4EFD8_MAGP6|nr:hypothetical protein MAPG_11481 [Magnaporthiopsis poae ATCC 64411]
MPTTHSANANAKTLSTPQKGKILVLRRERRSSNRVAGLRIRCLRQLAASELGCSLAPPCTKRRLAIALDLGTYGSSLASFSGDPVRPGFWAGEAEQDLNLREKCDLQLAAGSAETASARPQRLLGRENDTKARDSVLGGG